MIDRFSARLVFLVLNYPEPQLVCYKVINFMIYTKFLLNYFLKIICMYMVLHFDLLINIVNYVGFGF